MLPHADIEKVKEKLMEGIYQAELSAPTQGSWQLPSFKTHR